MTNDNDQQPGVVIVLKLNPDKHGNSIRDDDKDCSKRREIFLPYGSEEKIPFGRSSTSDQTREGRFDNFLVPDRSVSKNHGEIFVKDKKVYFFDNGSKWTSQINGITLKADEGMQLSSGYEFKSGKTQCEFKLIHSDKEAQDADSNPGYATKVSRQDIMQLSDETVVNGHNDKKEKENGKIVNGEEKENDQREQEQAYPDGTSVESLEFDISCDVEEDVESISERPAEQSETAKDKKVSFTSEASSDEVEEQDKENADGQNVAQALLQLNKEHEKRVDSVEISDDEEDEEQRQDMEVDVVEIDDDDDEEEEEEHNNESEDSEDVVGRDEDENDINELNADDVAEDSDNIDKAMDDDSDSDDGMEDDSGSEPEETPIVKLKEQMPREKEQDSESDEDSSSEDEEFNIDFCKDDSDDEDLDVDDEEISAVDESCDDLCPEIDDIYEKFERFTSEASIYHGSRIMDGVSVPNSQTNPALVTGVPLLRVQLTSKRKFSEAFLVGIDSGRNKDKERGESGDGNSITGTSAGIREKEHADNDADKASFEILKQLDKLSGVESANATSRAKIASDTDLPRPSKLRRLGKWATTFGTGVALGCIGTVYGLASLSRQSDL